MNQPEQKDRHEHEPQTHCCPCSQRAAATGTGWTRREFLGGVGAAALGGAVLGGLSWSALRAAEAELNQPAPRRALKVKPLLIYSVPKPQPQTSWRNWGGIQTKEDADKEMNRIRGELDQLKNKAEFPVEFLPVHAIQGAGELAGIADLTSADTLLVYAAGGWMDAFDALGKLKKDLIFFCRHKSGPVYLWYEIISPRYLRQHTDIRSVQGVDEQDVVVDNQDELLWRLRSLCGLHNTLGTRIVAIGGASAWAQSNEVVQKLVADKFKLDIKEVSYNELGELLKSARQDQTAVDRARQQAAAYLSLPGTTLETKKTFVENAFLLTDVFRKLMHKAECRSMTISGCMGTVMPLSETSACVPLSLLNDSGYMAFCESDFVVIPAGILIAGISGRPVFLNDPTYPHDGIITLAHCTAPRKMDGQNLEPARILTHFESDYGAAPKVEMRKGQVVTNIIPDFAFKRYVGLLGEIVDAPFLPICRSQIDIRYPCKDQQLAERMPGFHWITGYGDYMREVGYALKKVGITWEVLA